MTKNEQKRYRTAEERKYASVGASNRKRTRHKRLARRRRRVRLTKFGRSLLLLLLGVVLAGLTALIAVRSGAKKQAAEVAEAESAPTPEPTAAVVTPVPTPTLVPTPSPTPRPDYADPATRIPTNEEKANAVKGVMTTGGVALRQGPESTYPKLGKYEVDTKLNVFRYENDYYLVEIVDNGTYGYMAARFVELTTVSQEVDNTVDGTVNANRIAIRSRMNSEKDETRVGYLSGGSTVQIYYGVGDYYYIHAGFVDCYAKKEFIKANGSVPEM